LPGKDDLSALADGAGGDSGQAALNPTDESPV
jgi:hypothetical protein